MRRTERELFFWTAREGLKLIVLTALTLYFVISLVQGRFLGYEELVDLVTRLLTR